MTGRLIVTGRYETEINHCPCGREQALGPDFPFPDHVESRLFPTEKLGNLAWEERTGGQKR